MSLFHLRVVTEQPDGRFTWSDLAQKFDLIQDAVLACTVIQLEFDQDDGLKSGFAKDGFVRKICVIEDGTSLPIWAVGMPESQRYKDARNRQERRLMGLQG